MFHNLLFTSNWVLSVCPYYTVHALRGHRCSHRNKEMSSKHRLLFHPPATDEIINRLLAWLEEPLQTNQWSTRRGYYASGPNGQSLIIQLERPQLWMWNPADPFEAKWPALLLHFFFSHIVHKEDFYPSLSRRNKNSNMNWSGTFQELKMKVCSNGVKTNIFKGINIWEKGTFHFGMLLLMDFAFRRPHWNASSSLRTQGRLHTHIRLLSSLWSVLILFFLPLVHWIMDMGISDAGAGVTSKPMASPGLFCWAAREPEITFYWRGWSIWIILIIFFWGGGGGGRGKHGNKCSRWNEKCGGRARTWWSFISPHSE